LPISLFALTLAAGVVGAVVARAERDPTPGSANREASPPSQTLADIPDPKQPGGESESIVQVANLVYAGVKSSHCFSDHFLVTAEQDSAISTRRRFHAVKSGSE